MFDLYTVIDSIEERPFGQLQVRAQKLALRGDEIIWRQPHRYVITPGQDPDEMLRVVNAHLRSMQAGVLEEAELVKTQRWVGGFHTPDRIAAYVEMTERLDRGEPPPPPVEGVAQLSQVAGAFDRPGATGRDGLITADVTTFIFGSAIPIGRGSWTPEDEVVKEPFYGMEVPAEDWARLDKAIELEHTPRLKEPSDAPSDPVAEPIRLRS